MRQQVWTWSVPGQETSCDYYLCSLEIHDGRQAEYMYSKKAQMPSKIPHTCTYMAMSIMIYNHLKMIICIHQWKCDKNI